MHTKSEIQKIEETLKNFVHNFDLHFNNMDQSESSSAFTREIDKLWEYIVSISDIDNHAMFHKFASSSELYTKIQRELMSNQDYYEKITESEDAKKILGSGEHELSIDSLKAHLSAYNIGGLELAQYDIDLIDNLSLPFESFVMVGCGSLSYTMLDFALKHQKKKCVGIDVEKTPIHEANEIKKKFRIANISYERIDGSHYDYRTPGQCLIFVASLVKPKLDVVKRIANTAIKGSIVIMRNPVDFCNLLYEHADYRLIERLTPLKGNEWKANEQHLQLLSAYKIGD